MSLTNLFSLNYLVPGVAHKIDFSRAIRGLRGMPRRVLLPCHKLPAGTGATNTLIRNVGNEADAIALAGEGSMGVRMWRAAKANIDLGLPIDFIFVPEAGGATKATQQIVFTLPGANFTQAGEVPLYIGGDRVSVTVSQADTTATLVAALVAVINARTDLPITAAVGGTPNVLIPTCKWGGPTGNDIDVRAVYYPDDSLPAGLSVVIPGMSGGAGNPDVSGAIAAMAGYRPTEIAWPFTDSNNQVLMETELAARWAQNNMQDAAAVNVVRFADSAAALTYLGSRNSPHFHTIPVVKDVTNPFETAAMVAAVIESQAAIDPAVPHVGIPLSGYKGPVTGKHWSGTTPNDLLLEGASPLTIHADYTAELGRMVTNYTMNGRGAADRSQASLNWFKTMSYYRWYRVTEFLTKYYDFKCAEYITDALEGQKIMTAELGEDIMIGLYLDFMKVGLVQNLEYYKQTLLAEIDGPNGKLKIQDEPVLVTQLYQTEITSYPVAGHV